MKRKELEELLEMLEKYESAYPYPEDKEAVSQLSELVMAKIFRIKMEGKQG